MMTTNRCVYLVDDDEDDAFFFAGTYQALQAHPVWSAIPVCLLTSSHDLVYMAPKHGVTYHLLYTNPATIEAMKLLILDHMSN